jgi:hypothetical protein
MQRTANYINNGKKEAENIFKLREVQNRFIADINFGDCASRRFVREDQMNVVYDGQIKERTLYLFNDKLIIAR